MLNDTPQWVALYTNPRAEKRAEQRLKEAGYETYLPLQRKLHRWSDRWKSVEVPLFPSYIFVKIKKTDVVPIRGTEGVGFIVSWRSQPAIIPEHEIDSIRQLMAAEAEVHVLNDSGLKKGAEVRIVGGQFEGMEGMLISNCEDGNFSITISGLNVALVMQIEKALLEPIENASKEKGLWNA